MALGGGLVSIPSVFELSDFFASKFEDEGNGIVCLLVEGFLLSEVRAAAVAREKRRASAPRAQPAFPSLGSLASPSLVALTSPLLFPSFSTKASTNN